MEEKQDTLRLMVEKTVGLPLRTPGEFEMLIGEIHQRTGSLLSLSTVKRFWGYVDKGREGYRARQTTLDILSQFVGFHDWAAFCQATVEGGDESGPMVNRHLFVKEQQQGCHIVLRWQPDRRVTVRYEGDDLFTVVESINSKLRTGDTFHCMHIVECMPLTLFNIVREGKTLGNYICGKQHGVMFEKK